MIRVLFRLVGQGLHDLALTPWAQVFTLAAVTLVGFLAGLFLMALTTLNHHLGTTRGETAFQVYWHPNTDLGLIREQWQGFNHLPGFASVKTYLPDQALQELALRLGRDVSATVFPQMAKASPLPATALVAFAPRETDIERWINETAAYFRNLPGVSRVVTTPLRDELGQAWRKVSRYVMWPAVAFLTLVLGLVVGNTFRLSLLARAHEVEILQLVGAHNWYIRLPLVVGGAIQGLTGGLFALVLLKAIHFQVKDALNFSPLFMEIHFLPWQLCLALALVPMVTGMAASWLAVKSQGPAYDDSL